MGNFTRRLRGNAVPLAMAIVLGLVTACASTPPPPVASLQAARQAISSAEQSRAMEHAPLQLSRAREKLDAANNAVDNEDMARAARLAEESRVLAELAFATAEMEDARQVNREIVATTDMLREELRRERNRGGAR